MSFTLCLEGVDNSGKSTLAERLFLRYNFKRIVKEPNNYYKKLLTNNTEINLYLYCANRRENVELYQNKNYLLDRFTLSTYVYQELQGVNSNIIINAEKLSRNGFKPNLTIVLDSDIELLERRIKTEGKNLPESKKSFWIKANDRYKYWAEWLSIEEQQKIYVLKNHDNILKDIIEILDASNFVARRFRKQLYKGIAK